MEKTALVLSGGGSRGAYEIGVWQALDELGIKIDMVTGTSVGAINGALVAQNDLETAMRMWKELKTTMIFDVESDDALSYAKEIITKGGAGHEGLAKLLSETLDVKAIMDSPIDYGVVTVELPTFKPYRLMKKDIAEDDLIPYILASAACFPASQNQEVEGEHFIDGGYVDNLPVGMALDNGATKIIAVDLHAVGVVRKEDLARASDLTMIECHWDLGNFLVFDEENSERIMKLGYLDTMKTLGELEGTLFSFKKGSIDKDDMEDANNAGHIFEVHPTEVYTKESFEQALREAVNAYKEASEDDIKSGEDMLLHNGNFITGASKLMHNINKKTLTLLLAQQIKNNASGIHFLLEGPVNLLLKAEITAANYLIKLGLI